MIRLLRRVVLAPLVVLLTVLLWVTLPLWLIAARRCPRWCPVGWRALRLLWLAILYLTCEALLLVVMFGLWIASGFGWRLRTPYFERIHYDLVQGVTWVFFREVAAGAAPEDRHRRTGARRPPRRSRCWSAAGTPGPATPSR